MQLTPVKADERKLRIIHLANHCLRGHGNVHVAVDLACAQAKMGHDVIFLSDGGDFEPLLVKYGVNHIQLAQRSTNPAVLVRSFFSAAKLVSNFKPQILHAHMMAGAVFGCVLSKIFRSKLITTVHNSFDSHSALMRLGDMIASVSEADWKLLIKKGFNSNKTFIVRNGPINGAIYQEDPEDFTFISRPCLTTICGLHERKGVDDLINAFHQIHSFFPKVKFNIVGDGPDRLKLQKLCFDLDLSRNVVFHGNKKNTKDILEQTDIFLLGSHQEPIGLVNLEARAAGCAVIATDVGGVPEALDYGRAGILVPPRNPEAFAAAIVSLMADESNLNFYRAASKLNLEKFTSSTMCDSYISMYWQAIGVDL